MPIVAVENRARSRTIAHGLLALAALTAGCRQQAQEAEAPELPVVPVSRPVAREITNFVYYTGRADAVQSVDVRARVTGYLVKMPFTEGAEVKAGDLLFEIDPRPYQAQYDGAKAQLALYEANYKLAHAEANRSRAIARNDPGSISVEDVEKSISTEAQALANVNLTKANLSAAELNLSFTKVTSPIDGHISRYYYTVGNLVTQDQTLLTTVVSVDPVYGYFDMDERTVLRIRKGINEGTIKASPNRADIPVNMALEGEEGYPHTGNFNFVNNTVSLSTGTITVRALFPNPKPANGRRLITPGMFLRIQLPVGQPHPALLVADRAVGSDQGTKFVYVVDSQHKIQYRRVTLGELEDDGLRVVEQGLKADDQVVIGGLQLVRTNMEVEPESTVMTAVESPAAADRAAETARPQPPPPRGTPPAPTKAAPATTKGRP